MRITSPAFEHNASLDPRYTCQGEEINPPLRFEDVPENARSLVLIMDDPDAPDPAAPKMTWNHWLIYNMPPDTEGIDEGSQPPGQLAQNSAGEQVYQGPCPPIGTHRYFFKLYALDTTLPEVGDRDALENAMLGHIIDSAELIGLYKKR